MNHSAVAGDRREAVEVTKDRNGIDQVVLRNPRGASAQVSLHGGQVLSWKTDRGEEFCPPRRATRSGVLSHKISTPPACWPGESKFSSGQLSAQSSAKNTVESRNARCWCASCSRGKKEGRQGSDLTAIFKPPTAVRGGIPICFPQFGNRGSLEQHGFARNKIWVIDDNAPPLHTNDSDGKTYADLLFKPSQEDLKVWPHSFEFRLRVSLTADGYLTMISRIRNINCKPFSFSFAYHTYFSVSDISEVRVEGLETLDYLDNLYQRERFTEQGDALTFESEVDRVYLSSSDVIAVYDHEKKRTFVIRKDGLPDVVWNPWEKKSKSMVDFGDEEYKQMLCVDGAAIEKPITLKPGEEWTGRLELSVMLST
ncbi:hypothetical protein HYC85_022733 [Camellia sinensis]|uniref:glucose-6-phosphate 1-epimerase n=1 Tax=Camellia sinensis TaxID=4442 RepID=A0A7J7GGD4_CAMSI|nr:hypothetical protein HYC85_022733 [Camellia sinensis]